MSSVFAADVKIALITTDSIDQHWVTLNEGAQAKAKELGVEAAVKALNGESLEGAVVDTCVSVFKK